MWLSLALIFPLSAIFWQPIPPNDYWWYLRLGSEIIQTHAVPVVDTFSYTQAGQPMIYHSWLSAIFFFWLDKLGGVNFTLIVVALVIVSTYVILWKMMLETGIDMRLASLLLIAVELPGSVNWAVRPQLFAYPLFALSLYLLWRWEKNKKLALWELPLIVLLWVNLHGSFVLIFPLAGAAFVFGKGDRKKLAFVLIAIFLATLVNPRGIGVWEYIINSLTNTSNQAFSREWMPPTNSGWQMNMFFGWYLFFMAVAAFSPRKLSLMSWSWILGFGWLAFSGLRYGIWFLFILAPMSAFLLAELKIKSTRDEEKLSFPLLNIFFGGALLLIPFLLLPSIRALWMPQAASAFSDDTPVEAAAWLQSHPEVPDPIWADLAFESYLVYALPERPVWVDTRFEVYPPEHWNRYGVVSGADQNWEKVLAEDNINTLLLSKNTQSRLIVAVEESQNWDEIYSDQTSKIYLRKTPGK